MNTCETCVHWQPALGWRDLIAVTDNDLMLMPSHISIHTPCTDEQKERYELHNRESGICSKVDEGWDWQPDDDVLPLATVWDGSEYKAALHTHKSFGCVLHEPKEPDAVV